MQVQPLRGDDPREMGGRDAIFAVADYRRAKRGAMGTQLMGPPGDRQQSEPACPVAGAVDHPIIGDGIFAFLVGLDALAAAGPHPLGERQINPVLRQLRQADNGRPIDLARRLVAKGAGEEGRRGRGARDQENARGVLVEPVHQARPLGAVEAQGVEQAIDMAPGLGAALRRQPGRLVAC